MGASTSRLRLVAIFVTIHQLPLGRNAGLGLLLRRYNHGAGAAGAGDPGSSSAITQISIKF